MTLWVIKDFRGYYRTNYPDEPHSPDLIFARVFDSEREAAEIRDVDETVVSIKSK